MGREVISFHYVLRNNEGNVLDSSVGSEPLAFLTGGGQIIPGLETVLLTLNKGDKKDVPVNHKDGYGVYDQKLIAKVPKSAFQVKDLKVGDVFQMQKDKQVQLIRVKEINGDEVTIDGNHPLAGVDLVFSVEMIDKRPATADEISHGHAHGEGGHHH